MFNKLVKYDFILRYEAWVRASSFSENFPQISAKPIAFQRNLLGKLSRNPPFFTNSFSVKLASKIPAKFPRNRPFFPWICPWKSHEIWLFFRDLPEALYKSHLMERKVMLFVTNQHTLSLRPFKFFFQHAQFHWYLQLESCFIKWYEK